MDWTDDRDLDLKDSAPKAAHETPKKTRVQKSAEAPSSSSKCKLRTRRREVSGIQNPGEAQHIKMCAMQSCKLCLFIRNRHSWSARLPFIQPDMNIVQETLPSNIAKAVQGTWLEVDAKSDKPAEAFCRACNKELPCQHLHLGNMIKHHISHSHKQAVLTICGLSQGPRGQPTMGAPSAESFCKVLIAAQEGRAPTRGIDDVGTFKKLRRMRFCLAEAIACLQREHLSDAVIGLARDERHGRLLIRFTACSPELVVRTGVLWQKQQCPGSGETITESSIEGIQKFCTSFYGIPPKAKELQPDLSIQRQDRELVQHMVKAIEVMKVDSAANELLSASIMQEDRRVRTDGQEYHFKNMSIARDKAHGARRTAHAPMNM